MEKTVVEWLYNKMLYIDNEYDMKLITKSEYQFKRRDIIEQAKEMEKQQELKKWIETWSLGYNSGFDNCNKKYNTKQQEQ